MISNPTPVELLYEISQQLNSSLDLNVVIDKVLTLATEVTGASWASLFLVDGSDQVVRNMLADPDQPPITALYEAKQVMNGGVVGWVYRHREPLLVANTAADKRWVDFSEDERITRSVMAVPLATEEQLEAVLVLHHNKPDFFSSTHLTLTSDLSKQIAVTLANARRFSQVQARQVELATIFSLLPMPALVINEGRIISRNEAAEESLGLQQTDSLLAEINGGEALLASIEFLRANRATPCVEMNWRDERVFNVSISTLSDYGTVVSLDDITAIREAEQGQVQFVETVSHDLKTPLANIKGFGMLLQFEEMSERGKNNLKGIMDSADHMQALIDHLLSLAHIEAGVDDEITLCSLPQIIEDVVDYHMMQVEEKAQTLSMDVAANLPQIPGNPLRLSQVVSNLVSNAIKYTSEGGEVTIRAYLAAAGVTLEIADNGVGIPSAALPDLFKKFYRVDEHAQWSEGTGLGLSIVQAVIESYGGSISVESEVGRGSTFKCVFPISDGVMT